MKKAIVFILLFAGLYVKDVSAQDQTIKIKTSAVCGECKTTIEKALNFSKGVKKASLDVDSKMVTVVYKTEKTNPDKIRLVISNAGYDADSIPANPKAYSRLKDCCKKDGHMD